MARKIDEKKLKMDYVTVYCHMRDYDDAFCSTCGGDGDCFVGTHETIESALKRGARDLDGRRLYVFQRVQLRSHLPKPEGMGMGDEPREG
jgi:hypothetical protein